MTRNGPADLNMKDRIADEETDRDRIGPRSDQPDENGLTRIIHEGDLHE